MAKLLPNQLVKKTTTPSNTDVVLIQEQNVKEVKQIDFETFTKDISEKLSSRFIPENSWKDITKAIPKDIINSVITSYVKNGQERILILTSNKSEETQVWEYNLSTNNINRKTTMPTSIIGSSVIYYNNGTDDLMLTFGGSAQFGPVNDVWEYNITTDTWTQKTSGATARYGHTAIHYNNGTDDIMVIFGGVNGVPTYLNDVWEYNITTDTWTQKTSGAIVLELTLVMFGNII